MPPLSIRRATADDVETLSALIARTVIVSNTPDYEADAIRMLQEFAKPAAVAGAYNRRVERRQMIVV
jgi:hypothetical protein